MFPNSDRVLALVAGGPFNAGKSHDLLLSARYLRARAKEVLARANVMKNMGARRRMRAIAVRYEKLAQRLEKASGQTSRVPFPFCAVARRIHAEC